MMRNEECTKQKEPAALEQQMIYSVFVRNHTPEGTFQALEADLDRIQALGTDIVWLMPIHPTGKAERKGTDGSPYAIQDYRALDPHMGTLEEFKHLVDAIHARGMKCIIDVVYNHTSPDSVLYQTHPEWFYHNAKGQPHSIIEEWSDIIELDFRHRGLWEELISTLMQWSALVDGFRCDVASRIPLEFWKEARQKTAEVNPDLVWLAESTHLPFTKFVRDQGREAVCDAQLYEAFDVLYDYDVFPFMQEYLAGQRPLSRWMEELERQESVFPADFIKLRYLENHDQPRLMEALLALTDQPKVLNMLWTNWMALMFFLKGTPLVYHGQEFRAAHRPSIFDQDVVELREPGPDSDYIARLAALHRSLPAHAPISYSASDPDDLAMIERDGRTGFFLLKPRAEDRLISVPLSDGTWRNQLTGQELVVHNGHLPASAFPMVVEWTRPDPLHF